MKLISGPWPCALLADQSVACGKAWAKVPVEPLTAVALRGAGCGVTKGQTIRCWDYDYDTGNSSPDYAPALADVIDLGYSYVDLCAVRSNGAVHCGLERHGTPAIVLPADAIDVEVGGDLGGGGTATEHACAIMKDRGVVCWGTNTEGELGDGALSYSDAPVGVPFP